MLQNCGSLNISNKTEGKKTVTLSGTMFCFDNTNGSSGLELAVELLLLVGGLEAPVPELG